MASLTEIANRALQKIGGNRIVDLNEDSRNARSVNNCLTPLRIAELRLHPWNFGIKRASIASTVLTTTEQALIPGFNKYQLPSDFLRLMPSDPGYNLQGKDWQIEGGSIITMYSSPLLIRYIANITDVNLMDPLFREALSTKIAMELVEEITQSNTKKDGLRQDYIEIIATAKKSNAFENVAFQPEDDTWVTGRR